MPSIRDHHPAIPPRATLASRLAIAAAIIAAPTASATQTPTHQAAHLSTPALTLGSIAHTSIIQPEHEPQPSEPTANLDQPTAQLNAAPVRFGLARQEWWSITTGVAPSDATGIAAQIAYHRFVADDFEILAVLGGWYHDQDENDAASLSLSAHFRYHFINRETWSAYAMIGAGILASSDDVPEGGTSFNFLPTVGIGATTQLHDSNTRLDLGLRWHHISNGSFKGTDDNPDRDAILFYAGVMIPF